MGANATTFVPAYVSGEVLTAADLTVTNSGIPVFADSTARDNSFGGTGEKTLAEGQYAYLESTNATQVYDGSNWVSVGTSPGIVLVKSQVIGSAVASVTISDVFSATYDNYKIVLSGGVGSVNDELINMTLGATSSAYYIAQAGATYSGATFSGTSTNNGSSWGSVGRVLTDGLNVNCELNSPFLSKNTFITGAVANDTTARTFAGRLQNSTSYTAFTLTVATGTLTGGTIRVYGYANS
jgi:hypothetical protein